jgi:hypothetical protein
MHAERPLEQCTRWFNTLATHFPHLSRAHVRTLALWSFAATMTQHIASTTCAFFLARLFDEPQANLRQRLREFYWPAQQKPGAGRLELDVETCFAPLLGWILRLCHRAGRPPGELILALDVTLLRDRLAVISLSVAFRSSALPVAWAVLAANQEGAWVPRCTRLLERLRPAVPDPMRVLVLCDRGLQSPRLFEAICGQAWHPMMRLTRQGTWRPEDQSTWYDLAGLLPGPGRYYLGRGQLFKTKPLRCTLVALWEEGYEAPWLLMTNLEPSACRGTFYGLRAWIEQGFRCMKSGAYRCERLRVVEPERAERIFLVLAVSLVWTHALGSQAQRAEEPCALSAVLVEGVGRVLGVHRAGWIELLVAALRGEALPLPGALFVLPRPEEPPGEAVILDEPP